MRNLGWFLLACFFAFMLFLISSNNQQKNFMTQSGIVMNGTGEKNLDTLVEKLDDEISSQSASGSKSLTGTIHTPQKLSLFERFFGRKEHLKDDIGTDASQQKLPGKTENIGASGSLVPTDEVSPVPVKQKDITVQVTKPGISHGANLVKQSSEKKQPSVTQTQNLTKASVKPSYPKGNIGDMYTVAVKSLKLNNKNFSQTLGYLTSGDTLKQLGIQDNNACFEAEVITAKNESNIGKIGYVCQKYLTQGISQDQTLPVLPDDKDTTLETQTKVLIDISKYPQTKIGDIITLEKSGMIILKEYTDLAAGDKIDQMTDFDAQGCFIAHVYESALKTSDDMVGKICLQDIYK